MTDAADGERAVEAEIDRVVAALMSRSATVAKAMVDAIVAEAPAYARAPDDVLADVLSHCSSHVTLFLSLVRERRNARREDLAFAREAAARRVQQAIPIEALLQAFRIGQQTVWTAAVDETREERSGRKAAIALAGHAMAYSNDVSTHVAETYTRESERRTERVHRERRDLLENLLAGRVPPSEAIQALAPGLDHTADLLVAVATVEHPGEGGDMTLRRAADAIAACGGGAALVVVRQGEVVGLLPVPARGTSFIVQRLRSARSAMEAEDGTQMVIGVSDVSNGVAELPGRYQEAQQALRHAGAARPVIALADLSPFEHLIATADARTERSVTAQGPDPAQLRGPSWTRLMETLRAYFDSDLNVERTAARLFVHPNTVRYRLRRATELTGFDTRSFSDLVDLLTMVRIADRATAIPAAAESP